VQPAAGPATPQTGHASKEAAASRAQPGMLRGDAGAPRRNRIIRARVGLRVAPRLHLRRQALAVRFPEPELAAALLCRR